MSILRPCSGGLALALQGGAPLWSADLFELTLKDGSETYYWTSWPKDLIVGIHTYSSKRPWLNRGPWTVENTMVVPTMDIELLAINTDFEGGGNIKLQIHNGLFDGATFLLSRAYMTTPDNATSLGAVELFGGIVGAINLDGGKAVITVKGKNNLLAQNVPRNVYQLSCLHSFCDVNCTLNRASFTDSYVAGSPGLSRTFIPWNGAAPGNASLYKYGTIRFTDGPNSGQSRNVAQADSSGLTLSYPLYYTPVAGNAFTAFEGCDKTSTRCDSLGNKLNYRGFPYIPPPDAAY